MSVSSGQINTSTWTSRPYCDESDLYAMLDMLMEGRALTHDWHYAHVGELLFNYFMLLCHLNPNSHIRLWHDSAGKLIGYAILGEDPSLDWQVLTPYEWIGLEDEAIAWAQVMLGDLRQQNPTQWREYFCSGSRQDDRKRIDFLEHYGFRYSGKFAEVNMLRSLEEPVPDVPVPAGFRVCSMAEMMDITDRAAIHREVWQPWTVGNVNTGDYARFMNLPGYHPDLDVVTLTPDGVIASYVNGWIDPVNHIGDLGPVGAREQYRQRGLTRLALLESLRRMKSYGMDRVCISTGIANIPALGLYKSVGFTAENKYLDYVQGGPDQPAAYTDERQIFT